ncbi:MAG: diphthine--ammonia ligase [Candidatus Kryptoniota bacterium]
MKSDKQKAVINWSGGKDSALALHRVLTHDDTEVGYLLTTVNEHFNRISMHGVRTELLDIQAESIGIPLHKVLLPEMPDMETYDRTMMQTLQKLKSKGITASIFGDIFLEDLRKYRETQLAMVNLAAVFPLWQIPTDKLIREFIDIGFKAVIVCVNEEFLDKSFAGKNIDEEFIRDLPRGVDPCGENGEFHSFVYDGPIFKKPIKFMKGEIVYRRYEPPKQRKRTQDDEQPMPYPQAHGFWYCDLISIDAVDHCAFQKPKTCPSCGDTFLCGPTNSGGKCWCSELPNVMTTEDGKDCLCPTCLKKAIDKR